MGGRRRARLRRVRVAGEAERSARRGGEGEESGAGTRLHTAVLLETRKLTGLVGSRLCNVAEYRWT